MTTTTAVRIAFFGGLLLAGILPLAARAMSGPRADRCAFDGTALGAKPFVRVVARGAASFRFCGVLCAERWLARGGAESASVLVTDETSGKEIPAADAVFVRSTVVAVPTTGDRVHTFARREDAERHAAAYHGTLLEGSDRPFAGFAAGAGSR